MQTNNSPEAALTIAEIWRYPVKSVQGEQLLSAEVTDTGLVGDRSWCLFDTTSNKALTARREPSLLFAAATVTSENDGHLVVDLTLPDGTIVSGTGLAGVDDPATNVAISAWLGRPVELRRASPDSEATFETQADETETGEWIEWTGPSGSFHDSGRTMVSLVSQTTMRGWETRRFRINLIASGDGEDALVGSSFTVGSAMMNVTKQIDRCVVTTRPQPGGIDRDLSVLKTINAERDGFLGVGCLIDTPGAISVGDPLHTAAS